MTRWTSRLDRVEARLHPPQSTPPSTHWPAEEIARWAELASAMGIEHDRESIAALEAEARALGRPVPIPPWLARLVLDIAERLGIED